MELYEIVVWVLVVVFIIGSVLLIRVANGEESNQLPETNKVSKNDKSKK